MRVRGRGLRRWTRPSAFPLSYLSIVDASVPELLEAERVLKVNKWTDGKSCRLMDTRDRSATAEGVEEGDCWVPGGFEAWRSMVVAVVFKAGGVEGEVNAGRSFHADPHILATRCAAEANEERAATASSSEGGV